MLVTCEGSTPDGIDKIPLEVTRQRDVVADEWPVGAPNCTIRPVGAVEIAYVATVLAVNAQRHARQPRRKARLECREVARVHDRRPQPSEQSEEPRQQLDAMAGSLVQFDELDVAARHSLPELGGVRSARPRHVGSVHATCGSADSRGRSRDRRRRTDRRRARSADAARSWSRRSPAACGVCTCGRHVDAHRSSRACASAVATGGQASSTKRCNSVRASLTVAARE